MKSSFDRVFLAGCICRLGLGAVLPLVLAAAVDAAAPVDFNLEVRPILSGKCFPCHGPDEANREADLRLDVEQSAKGQRDEGRAIVPGSPEQSGLIARITSQDEDERMPPPDAGAWLAADQIDLLVRWIRQGAVWAKHWAYVPPARHPVPQVQDKQWPLNWVDYFILARLEKAGLRPSPEADPVTLVRRLSFDLTGLPPTPALVEQFVNDHAAPAYEALVDRLLSSPRYGERMAMYWLDLVRYADTVGYHGDQEHHISPYRDYVIDAFNDNMPFDRFTREQLAGDLLPGSGLEAKIATGYNRLLQTSHEGGVQEKEYLAIYAADRVRNLSAVWMGATMGCCQCHDHKFDPYTTKDFYAMVAFFADIDEADHLHHGTNTTPTTRVPEIKVLSRHERQQVARCERRLAALAAERDSLASDAADRRADLEQQIAAARARLEPLQDGVRLTMVTAAIKPRTIRVLPRGNWLDESGPVVEPAIPEFLGRLAAGPRRATRLDLACWLTDPRHGAGGLTARVFANRFWYLLFGSGIAASLEDFGGQGEAPYHPELLDNLAVEFVEGGWDVKHMLKLIVLSRAYRQSSLEPDRLRERDPGNRLYGRQGRYRLPAEMVRDAALAISGLLVNELGGASARPYQPAGYYRHLNFPTRTYKHDTDRRQWRRGVYVHWQRQFLHPMLKAFDAPRREECTAQRPRSNTPIAALTLLNDPSFVEAGRVLAERTVREGGETVESRLDFAFRRAVSRGPDRDERAVLTGLLATSRQQYEADPDQATAVVHTGLAAVAEDLDPAELAGWTAAARAILNLNETITRN